MDKKGIIAATNVASKFTGFCAEVVRRWAMAVYADFFGSISCVVDVDDDDFDEVFSSNVVATSKVISLINDKPFCVEASKYVRRNGYKKGEPNLTLSQFCKWVEEEHNINISERTASSWMKKNGVYVQTVQQRGVL